MTKSYKTWLNRSRHDSIIWIMTKSYRTWLNQSRHDSIKTWINYTNHDSIIHDMTQSIKTWLNQDMTQLYESWLNHTRHDSIIQDMNMTHTRKTWLVHMRHDSFIWDMTHTLRHDSYIRVIWLIHTRDMTHSCKTGFMQKMTHLCVKYDSFIRDMTQSYKTWLMHAIRLLQGRKCIRVCASMQILTSRINESYFTDEWVMWCMISHVSNKWDMYANVFKYAQVCKCFKCNTNDACHQHVDKFNAKSIQVRKIEYFCRKYTLANLNTETWTLKHEYSCRKWVCKSELCQVYKSLQYAHVCKSVNKSYSRTIEPRLVGLSQVSCKWVSLHAQMSQVCKSLQYAQVSKNASESYMHEWAMSCMHK